MRFTEQINAAGVVRLNGGKPTENDQGLLTIINLDAGHTYTLGYILDDDETFQAFEGTAATVTEDTAVICGKSTVLAISVGGTIGGGDNLQFGWSG